MKLIIESRINVNGTWWDITTEHNIPEDRKSEERVAYIKMVVKGLASAGLISRVAIKDHPTNQTEKGPVELLVETDDSAVLIEPSPPHCALHREPMSVSNVQKKLGHTEFYCRLKTGDGEYCKNRATVPEGSGIPKFWSVK